MESLRIRVNWFDLLNGQGVVFSDNEVNEKEPGVYELHYHKKDGMGNDSGTPDSAGDCV